MKSLLSIFVLLCAQHAALALTVPRQSVQERELDEPCSNPPDIPSAGGADQAPRAQTLNGTYYGLHSPVYNQDFFLGIPFAQPPIDDLRLRLPASLNNTWKGIRNATVYSPACYGYGEDTEYGACNYVSEDCLTLNVVRPAGYEDQKLPVAVWIYGGGFFEGSNRDPRYNLSFIVEQSVKINKPIIGVSINYRLSWFGWLYSEDVLDAGIANLGLRDQRLALHWIQENIGAFGGNREKVTIWGESAGAISVGLHILAYNGRDDRLFSGAISESGAINGLGMLNPQISTAEWVYGTITARAGCANATDKLGCLRIVPTEDLSSIFESLLSEGYRSLHVGPLIDGDIIARHGFDQMRDGAFVKVPYILGENADDGTDFVPFGFNNEGEVRTFFAGWGFDDKTLSELLQLYPNTPNKDIPLSAPGVFNVTIGTQFKRAATMTGDINFKAVRRLCSRLWTKATEVPLYSFIFNAIPNGIPYYYGVTHFQEVPFVFHNTLGIGFPNINPPYFGPNPFADRSQSYFDLADLMSRMWVSFVHDGNPNYPTQKSTNWPVYTLENPQAYVFDANVSSYVEQDTYRKIQMDYIMQKYLSNDEPWARHDNS